MDAGFETERPRHPCSALIKQKQNGVAIELNDTLDIVEAARRHLSPPVRCTIKRIERSDSTVFIGAHIAACDRRRLHRAL